MINVWKEFLLSLETEGGKLFVSIFLILSICGTVAYMNVKGHPIQEVGRELLTGFIGALFGIVLQYLAPKLKVFFEKKEEIK